MLGKHKYQRTITHERPSYTHSCRPVFSKNKVKKETR
jgi:hypothetical protein